MVVRIRTRNTQDTSSVELVKQQLRRRQEERDDLAPKAAALSAQDSLEKLGVDTDDAKRMSSLEFQEMYGVLLRQRVIEYLRTGNGPVARGFRAQYNESAAAALGTTLYEYLSALEQNAMMGDIELEAFGEMAGCNVIVKERSTYCLYATSTEAPTVRVVNQDNVHFSLESDQVVSGHENNCLAHSMLADLQRQMKEEAGLTSDHVAKSALGAVTPTTKPRSSTFFFMSAMQQAQPQATAQTHQFGIEAQIANENKALIAERLQRDAQRQIDAADYNKVIQRHHDENSELAAREQQQIHTDHAVALHLAGLFARGQDRELDVDLTQEITLSPR